MVTEFGMSERGLLTTAERDELVFLGRDIGEQRNYSEEVAALIDEEVRTMIEEAGSVALGILTGRRAALGQLAERLIAEETVQGSALDQMLPPAQPEIAIASTV